MLPEVLRVHSSESDTKHRECIPHAAMPEAGLNNKLNETCVTGT